MEGGMGCGKGSDRLCVGSVVRMVVSGG